MFDPRDARLLVTLLVGEDFDPLDPVRLENLFGLLLDAEDRLRLLDRLIGL
jgi:hypothetical protein